MVNVSPYNYPQMDNEAYTRSPDSIAYSQKSIVKNYTNYKTSSSTYDRNLSSDSDKTFDVKVYPNQTFGFLNQ